MKKKRPINLIIIVSILVLLGVIGTVTKPNTAQSSNKSVEPQKDNLSGREDMAFVISKYYVKDRLDAPETADFPWTDYRCRYESGGVYFLQSYVKCKNLYGVELKKTYNCRLKFLGGSSSDNRQWQLMLIEFLN